MYNLLRSQGYDMAYALAEFVDNAIQAFQIHCPKRYKSGPPLVVKLRFFSMEYSDPSLRNSIIIEDNGSGIDRQRLQDAFKPAKPVPVKGLSEFGIGMKAAAVWFTDTWSVTTTPIGDSKQYEFVFDLPALIKTGKDVVDVQEGPSRGKPAGTEIVLSNLRRAINSVRFDQIKIDLQELYQKFTAGAGATVNLDLEYDGTPYKANFVEPTDRETLRAPKFTTFGKTTYAVGPAKDWLVPISLVFRGVPVQGEVRLLRTGSYKVNPGIVLFRHNRVIEGISRIPFIPVKLLSTSNKYGRQRVYGELHLDDLPVSYTKDKFEMDEDEFVIALQAAPGMTDLLKQASEYRQDQGKIVKVKSEKDLIKKVGKAKAARATTKAQSAKQGKAGKSSNRSTAGATAKPVVPPLVKVLTAIKGNTQSLLLQTLIEETINQYQAHRSIGAALCLRVVVEVGTLYKVERAFPGQYSKVASLGIRSLLNYMKNHPKDFFTVADHRVEKCVMGNAAGGDQIEIIVLNNVAHGHYHPDLADLDRCATNLQALIEWAYS
jgi:hypothetical protein